MREIKVDDEVYAFLQRHATPFVDTENIVLRRLLLDEDAVHTHAEQSSRRGTGSLMGLLDSDLLLVGDRLVHRQPRKGLTHWATVAADGWLEVQGEAFKEVSPALRACVGSQINGWGQWTHEPSGRRLQDLREELRRRMESKGGSD